MFFANWAFFSGGGMKMNIFFVISHMSKGLTYITVSSKSFGYKQLLNSRGKEALCMDITDNSAPLVV